MSGEEIEYIKKAFTSNWIAPLGPHVDEFEELIQNYIGGGYAVAMNSGTSAIHIALTLLNIKEGDTVLCSSLTFVASANPILYIKAKPIFIDSQESDWNLCPKALKIAINDQINKGNKPKALIVVDLLGMPADYDKIIDICKEHSIPIIEDSAESLGATYNNKKCGLFGDFGVFSFNGNKILSTSGGGALICKTKEQAERAKYLITQARMPKDYYLHKEVGYNYRMSNIVASIGIAQMSVLNDRVTKKREVFEYYQKELSEVKDISFLLEPKDFYSNRWLSSFVISEQSNISPHNIIDKFKEHNIEARQIWKPLHSQPLFKDTPYYSVNDSFSDRLFERGISIPSGTQLSQEKQDLIIQLIKEIFN